MDYTEQEDSCLSDVKEVAAWFTSQGILGARMVAWDVALRMCQRYAEAEVLRLREENAKLEKAKEHYRTIARGFRSVISVWRSKDDSLHHGHNYRACRGGCFDCREIQPLIEELQRTDDEAEREEWKLGAAAELGKEPPR